MQKDFQKWHDKKIDSKRLKYRVGSISEIDFAELKKRIIVLLE